MEEELEKETEPEVTEKEEVSETPEEETTEATEEKEEATEEKEEVKEEKTEEVGGFERKMYKATCADCGKECEVPFKPIEGRAVYCRDCYRKHRPQRRERRRF